MKTLIGLTGGENGTFFEVLDVKETTVKIYPSIKEGKVLSVLEVGLSQDFWKYKKEVAVPGYYATVAGNAVCAASEITDTLDGYKAIAVNPFTVEVYSIADYERGIENARQN
jgi:hypothetical protein